MRIIHLINSLATGGAEQLVVWLSNESIKSGLDVRILTLSSRDGSPLRKALNLGIPVSSVQAPRDPFSIQYAVKKAARDSDLLHVHLFPSLYFGASVEGPKLFTEHNTTNRRRNNVLFRPLDRWAYQSYDSIVGVSKGVSTHLGEYFDKARVRRDHVETIHNGIPQSFFLFQRPLKRNYSRLVTVGSLTPQKNHSLALRVLKLLPNMTLDIAGSGPLESQLKREAKTLGLESRVNFRGNVDDIPALLAETDIFLSTSAFEGFGLAALEAEASAMPVVVPRVEGLDEVVRDQDCGRIYQGFEPSTIASAILDVSEPDKYRIMSKGARNFASTFTSHSCATKYLKLYSEVTSQRKRAPKF